MNDNDASYVKALFDASYVKALEAELNLKAQLIESLEKQIILLEKIVEKQRNYRATRRNYPYVEGAMNKVIGQVYCVTYVSYSRREFYSAHLSQSACEEEVRIRNATDNLTRAGVNYWAMFSLPLKRA